MTAKDKRFGSWEDAVLWLREQPDKQKLVLDGYYDDPLLAAAERYRCSDEWRAIREYLPDAKGTALDVGAGRGIASYALARDGFQVTALEPDASALVGAAAINALAQEAGLQIDVTQEFSERLPYSDESFDVVFARAVLHHTQDLAAACREFRRVLKPNGRLIAIREHVISRKADLEEFLLIHPLHTLYGGENAFLLQEYQSAISASGLRLHSVLGPLDSAINLSPYTPKSFCKELVQRVLGKSSRLAELLAGGLAFSPVWAVARRALRCVDHRPGRLYSFVAEK